MNTNTKARIAFSFFAGLYFTACGSSDSQLNCPDGGVAVGGTCYPKDCPSQSCAEDQVCEEESCVSKACAGVSCGEGFACKDGDCWPSLPCLGDTQCASMHRTCENSEGKAVCRDCLNGYHDQGGTCVSDITCKENSCNGHGTCTEESGHVACACATGYAGDRCERCGIGYIHWPENGNNCVDNLCDPDPCLANHRIAGSCDQVAADAFTCSCENGYQWSNGGCTGACEDGDHDGYGVGSGCLGLDCKDDDPAIYNGAPELCDGKDNDCNDQTDENLSDLNQCIQTGVCLGTVGVCQDANWVCSYPGTHEATEVSCDNLDNDCDGQTDEGPVCCNNTTKDGQETDIDCGGPSCQKCADGKSCLASGDCQSNRCSPDICQPSWWDNSFGYRQTISIRVASGTTPTGVQVLISLTSANVGAHFDWSRNCNDVRFSRGATPIPYWIESCSAVSQTASIWVKISSSLTTTPTAITLYYGNAAATTTSSGDNTFDFFDHFLGSTVDAVKWNVFDPYGKVSVANSKVTIEGQDNANGNSNPRLNSKVNHASGVSYAIKFGGVELISDAIFGTIAYCGFVSNGSWDDLAGSPPASSALCGLNSRAAETNTVGILVDNTSVAHSSNSAGTIPTESIEEILSCSSWLGTVGSCSLKVLVDGTDRINVAASSINFNPPLHAILSNADPALYNTPYSVDYVLVRRTATPAPEPASTFSLEEPRI
jgi:hypothetical protein